jgi:cyclopropane-fatty-acyl-phospholipid synthase
MATVADIQHHYDVSNAFYALFLDRPRMVYSCGVWDGAATLEEAQLAKLERIAGFANVRAGMRVLDVGCGWGGMLRFVVDALGAASAHGLTLSDAQRRYIAARRDARVTVDLRSWADLAPTGPPFDAIVSIGALEHFASLEDSEHRRQRGIYRNFFQACYHASAPGSRLGLQTIVAARPPASSAEVKDTKYLLNHVFPGSALPSVSDIQATSADLYEICDARRIGQHYARTLNAWKERLIASREQALRLVDEKMYEHYCHYFDAAKRSFEAGVVDLYQVSMKRVLRFRDAA